MGGTAAIVTGGIALALAFAALAALITVKVIGALKRFVDNVVEGNRRLAVYNGTIALAMARLDINRIRRDIHRGHEVAPSAKYAAEGLDRLEEAADPYLIWWQKAKNNVAGWLGHTAADWLGSAPGNALASALPGAGLANQARQWLGLSDEGIRDWVTEMLNSGMTEEEIEEAKRQRELLEKIEENTRLEANMPLGTQTLRRLENPNFQHSDAQGNVPGGPMPSLWEEVLR